MGTVVKTLKLLDYLSADIPEMGLSGFMRASGYDKASTHRRLGELLKAGFLMQDPVSRTYRLGPAIARLSLVREQSFPAHQEAMLALETLNATLQETVHVSFVQGMSGLSTWAHIDDKSHGNRVYIDPSAILPFHATASGLVVLAHSSEAFVAEVLSQDLPKVTDTTQIAPKVIAKLLDETRASGFGYSAGWYEEDVVGVSAPIFDRNGLCNGAVAAAAPLARMPASRLDCVHDALAQAARGITDALGGGLPDGNGKAGPAQAF